MQKVLRSIQEVVEFFDGPTELARWAGIKTSAVCNWVERNELPPGWHIRLAIEVSRRGARVHPSVLGLVVEAVERLRPSGVSNGVHPPACRYFCTVVRLCPSMAAIR
jgi:hypothetical protein